MILIFLYFQYFIDMNQKVLESIKKGGGGVLMGRRKFEFFKFFILVDIEYC